MFRLAPPRRPGPFRALVDAAGSLGTALTTPLLPEDFLGLVDPLWSATELRGRVVGVHRETDRAVTLRIRPGRRWTGHRAGQYVRLGLDIGGVRHWRTYSLSGPEAPADGCLSITVQELPGGLVSPRLVNGTPVGTVLHLEPAGGDFTLPGTVPDRLLMITAGSGITPVMAMLRTLAAAGPLPDVVLLHSAPTPADTMFGDELRVLGRTHQAARIVVRHTATDGRLALSELDTVCPDWRDREVFVCGPTGLLDAARAHWADGPERLRLEVFTPPTRSPGGRGGTVGFGAGEPVEVAAATSLLEAGEATGALMPSGCRMGICFSCVLPLRDGQVRDLRTGAVHGEPGDLIQTCVSGASGAARLGLPHS